MNTVGKRFKVRIVGTDDDAAVSGRHLMQADKMAWPALPLS